MKSIAFLQLIPRFFSVVDGIFLSEKRDKHYKSLKIFNPFHWKLPLLWRFPCLIHIRHFHS